MTDSHYASIKKVYSLDEVAKELSISEDAILDYASQGLIKVFIRISGNEGRIACINLHTLFLPKETNELGHYPIIQPVKDSPVELKGKYAGVEGLFVSPKDCYKILTLAACEQIIFDSGIKLTNQATPQICFPISKIFSDNIGRTEGLKDWRFAVLPKQRNLKRFTKDLSIHESEVEYPLYIELNKSRLFITKDEFETFKNLLVACPNRPPPSDDFINHENKSELLINLDLAAFELFGKYNPYILNRYKTISSINEYLKENSASGKFNFSNNVASSAAKFILQPDKDLEQKNTQDAEEFSYRTTCLKYLIEGWDFFYKNADLNDKDTFKSKAEINKWFKEKFKDYGNQAKNMSEHASTIIRPKNAKAGR